MLHKSYVSEVVDPLSDHLANWHGSPGHGPDLRPNDWDFLSISLLLTLTKTGQHSLPPYIRPQELRQGLPNSADGVLLLIPVMVRMAPDQPGCTPHTIYPLLPHGIPYWTARVYVTRSNETPQSLPLISLTSPEPTRH